jgi:hypothetical protein
LGCIADSQLEQLNGLIAERGRFGHREHVELAWTYLRSAPVEQAKEAMSRAVGHLAHQHGAEGKYNETMTHAWVHLVAVHAGSSHANSFAEFIAENPILLDQGLLSGHYRPGLLRSDAARSGWVDPDLRPLPEIL